MWRGGHDRHNSHSKQTRSIAPVLKWTGHRQGKRTAECAVRRPGPTGFPGQRTVDEETPSSLAATQRVEGQPVSEGGGGQDKCSFTCQHRSRWPGNQNGVFLVRLQIRMLKGRKMASTPVDWSPRQGNGQKVLPCREKQEQNCYFYDYCHQGKVSLEVPVIYCTSFDYYDGQAALNYDCDYEQLRASCAAQTRGSTCQVSLSLSPLSLTPTGCSNTCQCVIIN